MKKTEKVTTTELQEQKTDKMIKIVTSNRCYFRKNPSMQAVNNIVIKAPADQLYIVKKIVNMLGVNYYLLENGYYITSLEPHTLFNGNDAEQGE